MKLTFVVNDVQTEKEDYTTIRLARRAVRNGHDVSLTSIVDSTYEPDGHVAALASKPRKTEYEDDADILADLKDAEPTRIRLTEQDVVLLRSDPAQELESRPWAPTSGLLFAQLAASMGVIVLNDPQHLTDASNKTYFQQFPEAIRPATCITRDPEEIKAFMNATSSAADRNMTVPRAGSGRSAPASSSSPPSPEVRPVAVQTPRRR